MTLIFIQVITAEVFRARMLGSTDSLSDLELVNEVEYSMSANMGLTYREDVEPRCRKIELAYFEEHANERKFPNVNLHEWVGKNRSEILSAIHSCYAHWIDKNCPPGPTPFTSFPRWAEVVGGVMNCCGLGDPCQPHEGEDLLGGDLKQGAMKVLYELLYEDRPEQWIQKAEIYDAIRNHQAHDERLAWFGDLDGAEKKRAEGRIGKALISFQNRIFAGVRLVIDRSNKKTQQWRFRFTKAV